MTVLPTKGLIIGIVLLLSITLIHSASPRSRGVAIVVKQPDHTSSEMTPEPIMSSEDNARTENSPNDLSLANLADSLGMLPVIGSIIKAGLNYIAEMIMYFDQISNGLIARIVGGSLPCVISLENGIRCSGTSKKGGVYGVIEDIVMGMPSTVLPDPVKNILLVMIKLFVNPIIDVFFGGLPKPNT